MDLHGFLAVLSSVKKMCSLLVSKIVSSVDSGTSKTNWGFWTLLEWTMNQHESTTEILDQLIHSNSWGFSGIQWDDKPLFMGYYICYILPSGSLTQLLHFALPWPSRDFLDDFSQASAGACWPSIETARRPWNMLKVRAASSISVTDTWRHIHRINVVPPNGCFRMKNPMITHMYDHLCTLYNLNTVFRWWFTIQGWVSL